MKSNNKIVDHSTCWETAFQMTESKRKNGHDPRSIFMELNAHIFKEPTWNDVHILYYRRFISEFNLRDEDIEMEVISCE